MAEIETSTVVTEPENTTPVTEEKTFTQAEVDKIISERLTRARKAMLSDDEMKAYKEWKKTAQPSFDEEITKKKIDEYIKKIETQIETANAERIKELETQLNTTKAQLIFAENQQKVNQANCKKEFAEFVIDRISKLEGDFDKNLESFKKDNPQYFGETVIRRVSTSPKMGNSGGTPTTTNSRMNDILRSALRRN